jgi:hypothetical protein
VQIKLLQFNYGPGGGEAHFRILGENPSNSLHHQPFFAITVAYCLRSDPPERHRDTQEGLILSCGPQQYALFDFINEQLCNGGNLGDWPLAAEYRPKIISMMTGMLSFAELAHVGDSVPIVLPIQP